MRSWIFSLIALLLLGCTPKDDDGLVCELEGQCQVSYNGVVEDQNFDRDEVRDHCECLDPMKPCLDAVGPGEFSLGSCPDGAIAKCVYHPADLDPVSGEAPDPPGAQERYFYQGFGGYTYKTAEDLMILQRACEASGGNFEWLKDLDEL